MLSEMQISRPLVLGCAVLSLLMSPSFARAEDPMDLPPPPESLEMPAESAGAELPPPPEVLAPDPTLSAEAPSLAPTDALESTESTDGMPEQLPEATVEAEAPPPPPTLEAPMQYPQTLPPERFSSRTELMDLGMEDRLRAKELVLWLYAGASYGSVSAKGVTTTSTVGDPGGMGYNAGIGWMLSGNLQMALDVTGTPRTISSTVDSAMIGIGPRFGFIYLMALIGSQSGENINATGKTPVLAYGAKGGLDLILGHSKDSRVSYGIAPEVYYITPQSEIGGYNQLGGAVSFRIYGYENAF